VRQPTVLDFANRCNGFVAAQGMYQDGLQVLEHSSQLATYSDWPTSVELPHCESAVLVHVALDVICSFELQPYAVPNGVLQL